MRMLVPLRGQRGLFEMSREVEAAVREATGMAAE